MFLPECDVPVSPHALVDGAKGTLLQDCSEEARGLEVSGCSRLGGEGEGEQADLEGRALGGWKRWKEQCWGQQDRKGLSGAQRWGWSEDAGLAQRSLAPLAPVPAMGRTSGRLTNPNSWGSREQLERLIWARMAS